MTTETLAFVAAAGGVGTTRLTLECATLLARNGRDTVVLDAAYGTQGVADRTSGRIDSDMTELCLNETPLESGLVDRDIDGAGRFAVCPARAPFERLARAKTPEAAETFEMRIEEASRAFEYVLVDTPPIAANQAVAAATTVDAVAIVCDADRTATAVPRMTDRLSDIGVDSATTLVTRTDDHPDADVAIPTFETDSAASEPDASAHDALSKVVETTLGVDIDTETSDGIRSKFPL